MSEDFKYKLIAYNLPSEGYDMYRDLEDAYNDGWKPTSSPLMVQTRSPGDKGGEVEVLVMYTLAKERKHEH